MMTCPDPSAELGVIRSVLGTVDCHVRLYSETGYLALTGPQSFFPTALTVLMTIYVALLGFRLMFGVGGVRLTDAPIMALKIGLILTLTLNWATFQTLVFDLAARAPLDVARVVAAPARASGSGLAANPLSGLQSAYDELALNAQAFGKAAGPNPQVLRGGEAAAADGLWRAQTALFMSTAGILAISTIAVGVLAMVGPIFIALSLFGESRGLFAGWLRAIAAAAFTPMLCWITTTILLVILDPWLADLSRSREAGALSLETATIVSAVIFIFAAAQAALIFGAGVIAGGFQFPDRRLRPAASVGAGPGGVPTELTSRPERLAMQLLQASAHSRQAPGWERTAVVGAPSTSGAQGANAASGPGRGPAAMSWSPGIRLGAGYRRSTNLDRFRNSERKG